MEKVEIVKEVSKIMGVKYSHYDDHKMGKDYFSPRCLESEPKVVVYSGMSPWHFAILEDMTIITPFSTFHDTYLDCIRELGYDDEDKLQGQILDEIERIELSERYLKDNNYSEIINNKEILV